MANKKEKKVKDTKIIININNGMSKKKSKSKKKATSKKKRHVQVPYRNPEYNPYGTSFYTGGSIPITSANIKDNMAPTIQPSMQITRTNKAEYNTQSIVNPQITNGETVVEENQIAIIKSPSTKEKKQKTPVKSIRLTRSKRIKTGNEIFDGMTKSQIYNEMKKRKVPNVKQYDTINNMIKKYAEFVQQSVQQTPHSNNEPIVEEPQDNNDGINLNDVIIEEIHNPTIQDEKEVDDYRDPNVATTIDFNEAQQPNESILNGFAKVKRKPTKKEPNDDIEDEGYAYVRTPRKVKQSKEVKSNKKIIPTNEALIEPVTPLVTFADAYSSNDIDGNGFVSNELDLVNPVEIRKTEKVLTRSEAKKKIREVNAQFKQSTGFGMNMLRHFKSPTILPQAEEEEY